MSESSSSGAERQVVEVSATTVDEAVVRGLVRLGGLSRHEVNIEVLSEGKAGLLGFGSSEAKVRLSTLLPGEVASGPAGAVAPSVEPASPPAPEPTRSRAPEPTPEPKQQPPAESPTPAPPTPAPPTPAPPATRRAAAPVIDGDAASAASEIVHAMLSSMGFEEISTEIKSSLLPVEVEDEDSLVLSIHGPGVERLTHKDGRALQALQFISRLLLNRRLGQWTNLLLDVDDDRARRIKEIYLMAEQSAELVEREGRPVSLPPMTAYERRVVHLALREHESIATQSIGEGNGRKVTVRRKDQLLPEF